MWRMAAPRSVNWALKRCNVGCLCSAKASTRLQIFQCRFYLCFKQIGLPHRFGIEQCQFDQKSSDFSGPARSMAVASRSKTCSKPAMSRVLLGFIALPHVEDWKAIVWHLLEASEHTRVDRVGINKHHLPRVRNEAGIVVEGQTMFGQHP